MTDDLKTIKVSIDLSDYPSRSYYYKVPKGICINKYKLIERIRQSIQSLKKDWEQFYDYDDSWLLADFRCLEFLKKCQWPDSFIVDTHHEISVPIHVDEDVGSLIISNCLIESW